MLKTISDKFFFVVVNNIQILYYARYLKGKNLYTVSWTSPSNHENLSILYSKDDVENFINNNDWQVVENII